MLNQLRPELLEFFGQVMDVLSPDEQWLRKSKRKCIKHCSINKGSQNGISNRRAGFAFYDSAPGNSPISMADVYLHYTQLPALHVSSGSSQSSENTTQGRKRYLCRTFASHTDLRLSMRGVPISINV